MSIISWFPRLLRWCDDVEGSDLFADLDPS